MARATLTEWETRTWDGITRHRFWECSGCDERFSDEAAASGHLAALHPEGEETDRLAAELEDQLNELRRATAVEFAKLAHHQLLTEALRHGGSQGPHAAAAAGLRRAAELVRELAGGWTE